MPGHLGKSALLDPTFVRSLSIFIHRLVFANGESCQDWAKRLVQNLNLPRKPEDVFSLAFCAWAKETDSSPLKSNVAESLLPWWQKIPFDDQPLTGEQLFRFEVYSIKNSVPVETEWFLSSNRSIARAMIQALHGVLVQPTWISN